MRHFSADEDGIFELSAAFFAGQSALVAYAARVALRLRRADLLHRTVQVLCGAAAVHLFCTAFALAHYGAFSQDGVGHRSLKARCLGSACARRRVGRGGAGRGWAGEARVRRVATLRHGDAG